MRAGSNLVIDHETRAILAECRSSSVAVLVSEGIQNTFATNIPSDLKYCNEAISKFDIKRQLVRLSYEQDSDGKIEYVCNLPDHLITDKLKEKKQLAVLREKYISYQESFYRLYILRAVCVPNVVILPHLLNELNACDPSSDTYSTGISEYSDILEISNKEAYDELKLLSDNASIIYMRYLAWHKKNVMQINKLYTEEEMKTFSKTAWRNIVNEWNL